MENGKEVLIVEDEAITGIYLEIMLKKRGFTTHQIATTAEEAVECAKKNPLKSF